MLNLLRSRRILVTRPAAQAGRLAGMITARGGEAIRFPLLTIAPAEDLTALHGASARLDEFSLAVFISPNAVNHGLPPLRAVRAWPPQLRTAAVGPGTAAELAAQGITQTIVPTERFDSEALLALPPLQSAAIAGKKVLILRGNGGRELLAESLRERGAEVECLTCYRRLAPTDGAFLAALLRDGKVDAATISSSESLRNLLALLEAETLRRLHALPVFVPHQRIAETARAHGLPKIVMTTPGDEGIVNSLCAFDWACHE